MTSPPRGDDRGRPDYHDPTAGMAGAPPARSALTLRLILAAFGLVVSLAATIVFAVVAHSAPAAAVFGVVALITVVDLVVIVRRKARGEPG